MRKTIALSAAALLTVGLGVIAANPASAASSGSTDATVEVTGDPSGLSISVPDSSGGAIDVASGAAGVASLSGSLGDVTVTDTRAALAAKWTVSAQATDFVTGGGTADETIAASGISYAAGIGNPLSLQSGLFTPAGTAGTVSGLDTVKPVGSWAGVGNNTVTFTPSLTFKLLPSQVAGTYTGTITHSVL